MAGDILVAKRTAALVWQGKQVIIQAGETFARAGHPILDVYGAEFEPVVVHFDTDGTEAAPKSKNEPEAPEGPGGDPVPDAPQDAPMSEAPPSAPAAKDVRAWAKDAGVDVPSRGAIPEDVMAQYLAAHAEA